MTSSRLLSAASAFVFLVACARPAPVAEPPQPVSAAAPAPARPAAPVDTPATQPPRPKQRVAPPQVAAQLGLMGHSSTGVTAFRLQHPDHDGRGVLIAVLDGGVDPGIAGLRTTSTGERKILDLRDFSGEGRIALAPARTDAAGRVILPGDLVLSGTVAVRMGAASDAPWFAGVVEELAFGDLPQADLNGDGDNRDRFGVVVARGAGGWLAWIDLNGDGSLGDEAPFADYLVRQETFTFASRYAPRGRGPITGALNLAEENGQPVLTLVLDTSGHGSHVAGIAAGNDIYDIPGFDGAAPGAFLIGLRFADNRRGSVTTATSMLRALEYAARFAADRRLPLVINMSFGVGNARMGRAVSDSIVDAFLLAHPDVLFVVAAGNEGPGSSTMGQPGSAELALTVGAVYPRALAAVEFGSPRDFMGWWSSRGGALAKPDVVAPGVLYSTVPAWNTGSEIAGGTSMAAPHVAGLAAVLWSAARQESLAVTPAQILHALRATASRAPGIPFVDQGYGTPRLSEAWELLRRRPDVARVRVEALPARMPTSMPSRDRDVAMSSRERRPTAAYRRDGLAPGDTVQRYRVSLVPDRGPGAQPRARVFALSSDVPWLRPAQPSVTLDAATGSAVVEVRHDASRVSTPGRHSGAVFAVDTADAAAGPVFVLSSTILVPEPGRVVATGRRAAAGTADRYYVRVPEGAAGLAVVASVRDTAMKGSVDLFEPTDRPARGAKSASFGGTDGRVIAATVPAQYAPSGVWEIVVQALPGADVAYDLMARPSPVRIAAIDSAIATPTMTLTGEPGADTTLETQVRLLGVARDSVLEVAGAVATTWTVPVPAWAKRLRIDAELTPEQWEQVTDFAVTVFDASGARVAVEAMSFAYDRLESDLPARRADGYTATIELFPGFAGPPPATYPIRLRVRFEDEPRTVLATRTVVFPAGATLTVPAFGGFDAPAGWRDLLELRLSAGDGDPTPTTRLFTVPRTR